MRFNLYDCSIFNIFVCILFLVFYPILIFGIAGQSTIKNLRLLRSIIDVVV